MKSAVVCLRFLIYKTTEATVDAPLLIPDFGISICGGVFGKDESYIQ